MTLWFLLECISFLVPFFAGLTSVQREAPILSVLIGLIIGVGLGIGNFRVIKSAKKIYISRLETKPEHRQFVWGICLYLGTLAWIVISGLIVIYFTKLLIHFLV